MTHAPSGTAHPEPSWRKGARDHALTYLELFAHNPGVEKIAGAFDPHFARVKGTSARLHYLASMATQHWDFRKGRERYEITESFDIDQPGSALGALVHEGAIQAEMASASAATLKHYTIVAILGGAAKSPYNRLKYALDQHVTTDMLVYLGSERQVLPPEQEKAKDYAPDARTEFDLGVGAVQALLGSQITSPLAYQLKKPTSRIAHMQQKNNVPILLLSAPPNQGGNRANTADTYDFLRRYLGASLGPGKNILFATSAIYRYFQYFDAVREISLKTGADIEVIGFDPAYAGMEFKPSQFLQELKSAAEAAMRLHDAVQNGR